MTATDMTTDFLYIDSTERDSFAVGIFNNEGIKKRKEVSSVRRHAELLLRTIAVLIKGKNIKGIAVVKGPGSFTSLRIGIATANALAYALAIPICGVGKRASLNRCAQELAKKPVGSFVVPAYGRLPDIT